MQRRSFLVYLSGLCVCRSSILASIQERSAAGGCAWVRGVGPLSDTTSSSGNEDLDRALIAEVKKIDQIFQIDPGYRFLRDGDHPNAYATENALVQGTSGTVLFGLTLMEGELQTEYGGAAIAGIAAHEGAHILQYKTDDIRRRLTGPTAQPIELHADFMAGYYFSRTGRTERSLVVFAESLFSKGDYQYNDPGHHGTPKQRVASMRAGYGDGAYALSEALDRGAQYVINA
jgi:hypothetical protein